MAPFLPEPEVVAAPPKKNTKKTLALWVLLILLFLALWQFLSPSNDGGSSAHRVARAAPPPAEPSSLWTSLVPTVLPIALVVFLFILFVRAYRQNDAFNVAQEPGRLALAHKRFGEAIELFRATLPLFAKQPGYRAVATLNVAEALLKAARLDEALATCAEIERSRTMLLGSGVRTRLATVTALLYTLKGDVPLAERWAGEARVRIAKNKDDRIGHAAWLCLVEATLACRKGDAPGAVRLLDERWLELRYALAADAMRTVEIVRAFAEAGGGVRASNSVAERLVRVEPVVKGEFAWLGVAWPEMNAFLAATVDAGEAAAAPIATAAS